MVCFKIELTFVIRRKEQMWNILCNTLTSIAYNVVTYRSICQLNSLSHCLDEDLPFVLCIWASLHNNSGSSFQWKPAEKNEPFLWLKHLIFQPNITLRSQRRQHPISHTSRFLMFPWNSPLERSMRFPSMETEKAFHRESFAFLYCC